MYGCAPRDSGRIARGTAPAHEGSVTSRPEPPRPGEIVRIRDERWRVVHRVIYDEASLVEASGCDTSNRGTHGGFLLPFEPIDRPGAPRTPRLVSRRRWRAVARRALADVSPAWTSLRAATQADLRLLPFQLEPALALTRGAGCRFLIADAVGLGKTVQAGLMIAETLLRQPEARVLVLIPAALRDQWRQELLGRFRVAADVFDAAGVARVASSLPGSVNPWSLPSVVIASIDYVKRPEVIRALETLIWDVVVLDEAHALVGRSDRAAAARVLTSRGRAVVLLTATPHAGDDAAFAELCDLGRLNRPDPLIVFRRTRADTSVAGARRETYLRIRPTRAERAMHEALDAYARLVWAQASRTGEAGAQLAMSVLARRACSSAASLARSLDRRLAWLAPDASASAAQAELPLGAGTQEDEAPGAELRAQGLSNVSLERGHLRRLLALALDAAAAESKIAAARRLIVRAGEPAIVFTEYRDTLVELGAALSDLGPLYLHGALTARERAGVLDAFARGPARVLLATDAASEGLNLHHRCRLVINLELPWTALRLEQRTGRVDRIGQTRTVHSVRFVAGGTCEEVTLARLARRVERMQGALGLLQTMPDERRVAQSVLGGHPLPDITSEPPTLPAEVQCLSLQQDGRAEARRIAWARELLVSRSQVPPSDRSIICRVQRRARHVACPSRVWVFRLTITSASGRIVWEPLVTLVADVAADCVRHPADIRSLLSPDHVSVASGLRDAGSGRLDELRRVLVEPLVMWTGRERDLQRCLRHDHARLSRGLVQRTLFDRREERLAAAQQALLDEALSRSADRLRELEALGQLTVDSQALVFGVLFD